MSEQDKRGLAKQNRSIDPAMTGEVEPLGAELAEAHEQLAATSEVLAAIGRSASDLEGVLSTVVEAARRLCGADAGQIFLIDGERYRLAYGSGVTPEYREHIANNPMLLDRGTLAGRVGLDRRATQIIDVLADPDYSRAEAQRVAGYRTLMGVPMLLDSEVVGVLSVWRTKVDPFTDRAVEVLMTFAAQAALAVRSVNLVRALENRTVELGHKVDQLEALGAVGEAVSSSLNLTEVLTTIVTQAVLLSGTDGGSIYEFDEDSEEFHIRTVYGTSPEVLDALRRTRIGLDDTFLGEAARQGRPMELPDLRDVPLDPHLSVLAEGDWRSLVAVPMLRQGRIVGAMVVRRHAPGHVPREIYELLETFASQSALALLNAQLFRELEEQSVELEKASRHKSEFLASMSHELRTPLNAVLGFSEVLLERMFGDINPRQEEYLRDIHGSGKHLLELLNEILDLSKVEAGRMELEYSAFDLRSLLDNAASMLRERAGLHAIEVSIELEDDVGELYSDELRLKQVVLNLLTNAVKFTGDGGSVVMRTVRDGAEILITVTDTGIGVPEADRQRIFESFQQGGRGGSREEGTGLGLTLSRRIVELLGGRMWLETEIGRGSTFGFSLPAREREPTERSGLGNSAQGCGEVVVIEDDRSSLDLFNAYLSGAALKVISARDGQSGLAAVRRTQPDAVLLDIRLPGIDGWAVLKELKAQHETRDIPVIVVSIVDERARGVALGAAAYLVKPIGREQLLAALAAVGTPVQTSGNGSGCEVRT